MAFTRKFLIDNGVPEDKVDVILGERQRTLSDYVPKADVQAQIDEAMKTAPQSVNVTESEEYKALQAEYGGYKVKTDLKGKGVKEKFLDDLLGKIDREKELDPQLEKIKETYSEFFETETDPQQQQEPPNKPTFAVPPKGPMPTGDTGKKFGDVWGFAPKKE